jgi:hypothetical protein
LKNKELEREVSSVRILLHHTQTALSNETTAARASSVLRERNYDDAEEFDRSASAISRLKKSVQRSQKGSEYQTDLRNTSRLIPVPALDLFDKPKSIFSESVKENNAPLKIEDLEQPIGQTIGSESEVTQIRRMIFEDQLPWEAPTALIKTEAPAVLSVKTSETIDAYDLRADTSVKVKEPAAVSANTNDASSGTNHQKETISSNAMEPIDASNPKNDDYHTISTQSPVSALNPYVSAEQSEGQESFEGSEIASIPADRDDLYAESKEAIEPKSVTVDEFAAIEAEPELQKYLRIAAANKQHHQTTSFDDDNDNEQRPAEPVKSANDAYANLDDFEGATESSGMRLVLNSI